MTDTPPVVLIIDDDLQIRRFLRAGFDLERFTVLEETTGQAGLRTATLRKADLIVVDLNLPDMDGASIVERIRAWSTVPIIVLSVRASDNDKVRLLECGADDYVVKPFSMVELVARARAAIRRQTRGDKGDLVVKLGRLSIDLANRAVFIDGARVVLSPKEYRLLQALAQHAGNVVTHNILMKEVWGVHHLHNAGAQIARQDRAEPKAAAHSGKRARRRLPAGEWRRVGLTAAGRGTCVTEMLRTVAA
jgi:two-component system KDP operon response regulator KdpE